MINAVLFDRDGTLIHDVPYLGDPALVRPIDGAAEALAELRRAGLLLGVVTNQSGIARGLITHDQVAAVNTEVERQLGPFDIWQICPHQDADHCLCRKPAPGLIIQAAKALHVAPAQCLIIGDRSTDVDAAKAAGAAGIRLGFDLDLHSAVDRRCATHRRSPGLLSAPAPTLSAETGFMNPPHPDTSRRATRMSEVHPPCKQGGSDLIRPHHQGPSSHPVFVDVHAGVSRGRVPISSGWWAL